MAINITKPVREAAVRNRDGSVTTTRHGVDDGRNFVFGTNVVEEDGVLRRATPSEVTNYIRSNAEEAELANMKELTATAVAAATTPTVGTAVTGGVPEIIAYLQAKFPNDFA